MFIKIDDYIINTRYIKLITPLILQEFIDGETGEKKDVCVFDIVVRDEKPISIVRFDKKESEELRAKLEKVCSCKDEDLEKWKE